MGKRSKKCNCPKFNSDGYGYIICKDCPPEKIREAVIISDNILGLYTYVLIHDYKKYKRYDKEHQKRRDK